MVKKMVLRILSVSDHPANFGGAMSSLPRKVPPVRLLGDYPQPTQPLGFAVDVDQTSRGEPT